MKQKNFLPVVNVVVWLLVGVLTYARSIEPNWIKVEKVRFHVPTLTGGPIRIVHLADLHISRFGFREKAMVKKVNDLEPDLVLVTGDISQYYGWTGEAINVLNALEAKTGVLVTLGDADYSNRKGNCTYCHAGNRAQPLDFTVLRYKTYETNLGPDRIIIAGVDDPSGPSKHKIPGLNDQQLKAGLKILLLSSPSDYENAAERGYDIILSGDTHGGQVSLLGLVPRNGEGYPKEWLKGWVNEGLTPLYINSGLGTNVAAFRFGVRPEIVCFEISS